MSGMAKGGRSICVVHAASVVEEDVLVSDHEVFMKITDRYLLINPDAIVSV